MNFVVTCILAVAAIGSARAFSSKASSSLTFSRPTAFAHAVTTTTNNNLQSSIVWLQLQATDTDTDDDPMQEAMMDEATRAMLAKQRRADELRAQEVFMTKSTGKHKCGNCDWEYDEKKGDAMMIGGMVKPGTKFDQLEANWRCPVCRASKDSFQEVTEEIAGFEVNQGYGFGTNSWTAGQKNLAVFGGLGLFFVLFLSGYAMS
jgi:rubredoxin